MPAFLLFYLSQAAENGAGWRQETRPGLDVRVRRTLFRGHDDPEHHHLLHYLLRHLRRAGHLFHPRR